jgi:hypothetical protein
MSGNVANLHTGFQGAGKTLFTLAFVERLRKETGREVYYSGIRDCTLEGWREFGDPGPDKNRPWETNASKWYELPHGAIIVIDEAQRLFRAGGLRRDPPPEVTAMETLRHRGHDLFLVTQDATLIDAHVRKLCGTHRHLMRKFGTGSVTVHQWVGVRENAAKSRKDSQRSSFRHPKVAFGKKGKDGQWIVKPWYTSAEVHTVRVALPWKLIFFLVLVVAAVCFAGYRVFSRVAPPEPAKVPSGGGGQASGTPGQKNAPKASAPVHPRFDYASYQPRIESLPHTAPRYDDLTKPVRVPVVVGCVLVGDPGRGGWCFTQQGTKVPASVAFIKSYLENGYFRDFDPDTGTRQMPASRSLKSSGDPSSANSAGPQG